MIDITKPYRTRDGRDVRIYAVDGGGDYPIHGAFRDKDGWTATAWTRDGAFMEGQEDGRDLPALTPRIRKQVYLVTYDDGSVRTLAERPSPGDTRIAGATSLTAHVISCDEGEGL